MQHWFRPRAMQDLMEWEWIWTFLWVWAMGLPVASWMHSSEAQFQFHFQPLWKSVSKEGDKGKTRE